MNRLFLLMVAVMAVALFSAGCGAALQGVQTYQVNCGGETFSAYRIDDESVALHSDLGGEGWTAMLLERRDRGVRYTVEVHMGDRVCRGSGYFYDSDTNGAANFDLRWNNREFRVTQQMRPFLDRWFEVVDECHQP